MLVAPPLGETHHTHTHARTHARTHTHTHTHTTTTNNNINAIAHLSGGSMGATTALWYSRTSGVGGEVPGRCRWPSVSVGLESLLSAPVGVPALRSGLRSWLPPPLLLLLATAAAAAASAAAASASICAALALPWTLLRYWLHVCERGSQMVSSEPPASSAARHGQHRRGAQ
jgi:hypothetical protein